jgi:hypothetical protein
MKKRRCNSSSEMYGACGMYGERRGAYGGLKGSLRERDHLEGQGLGGRILLNGSESNGMGGFGRD